MSDVPSDVYTLVLVFRHHPLLVTILNGNQSRRDRGSIRTARGTGYTEYVSFHPLRATTISKAKLPLLHCTVMMDNDDIWINTREALHHMYNLAIVPANLSIKIN